MQYQYEQINYQDDLPVNIFTQTVERFPYHWHEDTEILLILDGELEIRIDKDRYRLESGDIFLVNGNELHFIDSYTGYGKTQVLAMQMDSRYLKELGIDMEQKRFYLNSRDEKNAPKGIMDELKYILANMMDLIINKKSHFQLKMKKWLLELAVILLEHFEVKTKTDDTQADHDQRLLEILKYMNKNCMNAGLSLQNIADEFTLNPQYLSRYFKAKVGVSFKKKLDNMRLNKSLIALQTTDQTVTEIALQYGFPDSKAYYRVFKEVIGTTPKEFRDAFKVEVENNIAKDYLSINSSESLANLFKYLQRERNNQEVYKQKSRSVTVDLTQSKRPIHHTFTNLLTFGYAPLALRHDFNQQLTQIQKEIGFKYVRFHGIFADQMHVYNENSDGSYYFNFNYINVILDNLLKANVKPFIEIGFMPKDLASTEHTIFVWEAHVSPPKLMERWKELMEEFVRHLINRYGLDEIRTWYFEFWNEPEVPFFWRGTREEFFTLFAETYESIKSIDSKIKIGGFSSINFVKYHSWIDDFHYVTAKKNIDLDFFTFHVYNLARKPNFEPQAHKKTPVENIQSVTDFKSIMIGDEHNLSSNIDSVLEKSSALHKDIKEVWITEWNGNSDSQDLLHDTCYMAAFIAKTAIENFEKVNGMGYWTFTDVFEEFSPKMSLFHGGFGLMTYNGIKKAGYHAFYFLSQLGNELIVKRENMIVTKRGEDYQIIIYNYSHPNYLYRSFDYSQLSQESRYSVFEDEKVQAFQVTLNGMNGGYRMRKQYVNREQGSSYDSWVNIGAPIDLDDETVGYLKGKAEPGIKIEDISANQSYTLITELLPHEIQFIEFKKRY
ncbi:GH39 family glycosyl hydrolase [Bacillus mesophilum]|uniref:Helix-turn-helix domain-containing protein n=1 Tax=Bacillus mesophilum TaxID=1071718 RepID=A0A7V7RJT5_9BACI|nr:helix-turn-helix domain-containing protein [Bacillus mesophilum]KAB2331313.1 helix-turn-helix domain-containing protein [Bacillus mesophilum]